MIQLKKVPLYWRTIKNLKPIQIYGRLLHKLTASKLNTKEKCPSLGNSVLKTTPIQSPSKMLGPMSFQFLNLNGKVKIAQDWNNPTHSQLWLFNLHYFDDLNSSSAKERLSWHSEYICKWIQENPPCNGNGWYPYTISLRSVNWMKWHMTTGQLTPEAQSSLALQMRYLQDHCEDFLQGNHLFVNGKALIFAGIFFDRSHPETQQWLESGMQIIGKEIEEQTLSDGMNYELSPMYHSLILEDILDIINLLSSNKVPYPESWNRIASKMLTTLSHLTHPDGEICFFNDCSLGISKSPQQLFKYGKRLELNFHDESNARLIHKTEAGLVRFQNDFYSLFFDGGPIGPGHVFSHAHCDTASIELSLGSQRLLVNQGTSQYGIGAERHAERSTKAHNTAQLNDFEQSEIWSGFRVGHQAQPLPLTLSQNNKKDTIISGGHCGYKRFAQLKSHQRTCKLSDSCVEFEDTFQGQKVHSFKIYWRLHPQFKAFVQDKIVKILQGTDEVANFEFSHGQIEIEESYYAPEFGRKIPCQVVINFGTIALPNSVQTTFTINGTR